MSCCEPQLADGNTVEIDHVQNVDEAGMFGAKSMDLSKHGVPVESVFLKRIL